MIWFKKNKINLLKKNFPNLKNISFKDNNVICTTDNGIIDSTDARAMGGFWCAQFKSSDGKIVSLPETSKSLVNSIRKPLQVSREYAYYGYVPVTKRDKTLNPMPANY